jgi:hypothetical protein
MKPDDVTELRQSAALGNEPVLISEQIGSKRKPEPE